MTARNRHQTSTPSLSKKEQLQQIKRRQSTIMFSAIGFVLVIIAVLSYYGITQAQQEMAALKLPNLQPQSISGPAIDVELTDLEGNPVKFSDYKGDVILYNAWATWCPPCKEEMPIIAEYYQEHAGEGFVVLAISDGEPADLVNAFKLSNNIPFPMWADSGSIVSSAYGVEGLPTSFVIDRDFNVVYRWSGGVNKAVLDTYITPLLTK